MGSAKSTLLFQLVIWISAFSLPHLLTASSSLDDIDPCDRDHLPDPLTLRRDQLTVLINGYSEARLPLLRSLALSYSSQPAVAAVLILWGNPVTPSHTLVTSLNFSSGILGGAAQISVIRHPTTSLNARFLPRREIRTRAVAICDDDVEIDPRSLAFAFTVWKSHQDLIVGLFARSHDLDITQRAWIYTVHPDRYSIVLTKFMVLKTEYLHRYSCGGSTMREARRVVDEMRNCEDILMNFLVAMESGEGPVLVEGRGVRDWGDVRNEEEGGGTKRLTNKAVIDVGLSSKGEHRKRRGECIREFHKVLGRMPLRYSYGKVVEGVGEQGLCEKGGKLVFCDQQPQEV